MICLSERVNNRRQIIIKRVVKRGLTRKVKKFGDGGSASLEASLVIPLFLIAMVSLYTMLQSILAENIIYEASVETVEYMAEMAYLGDGLYEPGVMKFRSYVDDEMLLTRHIDGGYKGVHLVANPYLDQNQMIHLQVLYKLEGNYPFGFGYEKNKNYRIHKRAYVGKNWSQDRKKNPKERYVYVTDNRSVYHLGRNCTHLKLSVHMQSIKHAKKDGYTSCEFCGDSCGDYVYITNQGSRYHSNRNCSGLKRSVERIKVTDTAGLPLCQRCREGCE